MNVFWCTYHIESGNIKNMFFLNFIYNIGKNNNIHFFRIKHENNRMIFESTEHLRKHNCSITSFSTGYKEVIILF